MSTVFLSAQLSLNLQFSKISFLQCMSAYLSNIYLLVIMLLHLLVATVYSTLYSVVGSAISMLIQKAFPCTNTSVNDTFMYWTK